MPGQNETPIRIPQLPGFLDGNTPAADDLVIVYDASTGTTRQAKITDLPFSAGGGAGGVITYAAGLWKVHNYSAGFHYDDEAGNCIISDLRLLGITDGMVASTQVASEFRDEQLSFDAEAGTLSILNFELSIGEHITININGAANYAYNSALQNAVQNIADQAAILSPFKPTVSGTNGAKVLWLKPANMIPPGWQECVMMRGRLPMAQDPADLDFSGQIGVATGGGKSKKLTIDNIPEHDHDYRVSAYGGAPGDRLEGDVIKGGSSFGLYLGQTKKTSKAGKADPDAISLLNPYRIVMWIEYIGLD